MREITLLKMTLRPNRRQLLYYLLFGAFGGKFVIRPPGPEPKKATEREHGTSGYAASPAADPLFFTTEQSTTSTQYIRVRVRIPTTENQ